MDSNVFCVLCGASFDIENHVYNIDPETKTYQVSSRWVDILPEANALTPSMQWVYNVRLLSDVSALCNLRRTSGQERCDSLATFEQAFKLMSNQWPEHIRQ
jgi:hypothetical protein